MKGQVFASGAVISLATTLAVLMLAACNGGSTTGAPFAGPTITSTPAPPADPAPPAFDLTGRYTMELLASPSCSTVMDAVSHQLLPFPRAALPRRYDATITQRFVQLEVLFTPMECRGGYYERPGICAPIPAQVDCHTRVFTMGGCAAGSTTGRDMTFGVTPAPATPHCGGGDYWWEEFTATEVFEACGFWSASIDDPAHITGTVNGTFGYLKAYADRYFPGHLWESDLYCSAADHHFTLEKR